MTCQTRTEAEAHTGFCLCCDGQGYHVEPANSHASNEYTCSVCDGMGSFDDEADRLFYSKK